MKAEYNLVDEYVMSYHNKYGKEMFSLDLTNPNDLTRHEELRKDLVDQFNVFGWTIDEYLRKKYPKLKS